MTDVNIKDNIILYMPYMLRRRNEQVCNMVSAKSKEERLMNGIRHTTNWLTELPVGKITVLAVENM